MDRVIWTGLSGQQYSFETYPVYQKFLPVSGVYIFCKPQLIDWLALYVGETESFENRLNTWLENHDGFKRARQWGASHIGAMVVRDKTERLAIEADLRHGLQPQCNKQGTKTVLTGLFD